MTKRIGIIGGGQLGMMLIEYGFNNDNDDVFIRVLDPDDKCSANNTDNIDELFVGSWESVDDLLEFAESLDVITFEIEHINIQGLKKIHETYPSIEFIPSIETLETIQNKVTQKEFMLENNIPTLPFQVIPENTDVVHTQLSSEVIWKSACKGYDGHGVQKLKCINGGTSIINPSAEAAYIEPYIKDREEYSVIVIVFNSIDVIISNPTKMVFHETLNMLDYCTNSNDDINDDLKSIALKCATSFNSKGLFAVEMLVDRGAHIPKIYVNEVAPRPHNSCHHTIHACPTSAYKYLSRLLINPTITRNDIDTPHTPEKDKKYVMKNILGPKHLDGVRYKILSLSECGNNSNLGGNRGSDTKVVQKHLIDYKKSCTRPHRKIGHITLVSEENISLSEIDRDETLVVPVGGVAVVMGSTSDWNVMKGACDVLDQLGVPFVKTVISAHRTPSRLTSFANQAYDSGIRCIIAGAGGAAHLPGMIAANTCLPVIGVPVKSEKSVLNGVDALHSIVQMPPGVPVACVAINGSKNAGILAAQILGKFEEVAKYKKIMSDTVLETCNDLN